MSTASVKRDLLENCKDAEYRSAFVEESACIGICSQIRVLRENRSLSQKELGHKAGMAQERISILEDPNATTSKPTLATLLRIAVALDVGLDVRFVSFATVLDRSVHTTDKDLDVPSFAVEVASLEKILDLELEVGFAEQFGNPNQYLVKQKVPVIEHTTSTAMEHLSDAMKDAMKQGMKIDHPQKQDSTAHAGFIQSNRMPRKMIVSSLSLEYTKPIERRLQ